MSELVASPSDIRTISVGARPQPGFGAAIEQIRAFTSQPAVAKAMPALMLIAMAAIGWLVWSVVSAPPQRDLFRGLGDADKASVADALGSANIAYEIDRSSGALSVSEADFYQARMLLAQQGLPKSAPSGEEVLTSLPLGSSRAVEGERLRSAREQDLARTIEAIDAVQSARVHIAVDQPSVFMRTENRGAASVMLKINAGRSLTEQQVAAIASLVSSSVPGLAADQVSIVDQSGKLLSRTGGDPSARASDRQIEIQSQIEARYSQSLTKLLTPLVGAGNFTAEVHADVDFNEVQATREIFPKDTAVVRAEQGGWTKSNEPVGGAATGIPGALSNVPPPAAVATQTPPAALAPNGEAGGATTDPTRTTENYNRTFELGREISVTKNQVGQVRRVSVAVALRQPDGKPRSPTEIAAIEALVKGAIGYSADRGDLIAVSARSFATVEETAPIWYEAEWVPMVVRNATALLVALLVVFGLGRPLLKKLTAATKAAPAAAAAAAASQASDRDRQKISSEIAAALVGQGSDGGANNVPITLEMIESAPGYAARASLIRNFVRQDPARAALVVRDLIRADAPRGDDQNG